MECRYANDERMSAQRRTLSKARERDKGVKWFRLSEQIFRVDKWSLCRG